MSIQIIPTHNGVLELNENGTIRTAPLVPTGLAISDAWHNSVKVDPEGGGDFKLWSEACDYVTSQSPSASNRWLMEVTPGAFDETITPPSHTTLRGSGDSTILYRQADEPAIEWASDTTDVLFQNMTIDSDIDGLNQDGTIRFDTGVTGCSDIRFDNCVLANSTTSSSGAIIIGTSSTVSNLWITNSRWRIAATSGTRRVIRPGGSSTIYAFDFRMHPDNAATEAIFTATQAFNSDVHGTEGGFYKNCYFGRSGSQTSGQDGTFTYDGCYFQSGYRARNGTHTMNACLVNGDFLSHWNNSSSTVNLSSTYITNEIWFEGTTTWNLYSGYASSFNRFAGGTINNYGFIIPTKNTAQTSTTVNPGLIRVGGHTDFVGGETAHTVELNGATSIGRSTKAAASQTGNLHQYKDNLGNIGLAIGPDQELNYGAVDELTVASGAITALKSYHSVDTESDAATDDLDTINGGTEGDILIIRAADSARTVVAKDATGNLALNGDFSMDNAEDTLQLLYDGSNWLEVSRSNNGT